MIENCHQPQLILIGIRVGSSVAVLMLNYTETVKWDGGAVLHYSNQDW